MQWPSRKRRGARATDYDFDYDAEMEQLRQIPLTGLAGDWYTNARSVMYFPTFRASGGMADTLVLGTSAERRRSSTLLLPTKPGRRCGIRFLRESLRGRALPSQGRGRGCDARLPLQLNQIKAPSSLRMRFFFDLYTDRRSIGAVLMVGSAQTVCWGRFGDAAYLLLRLIRID